MASASVEPRSPTKKDLPSAPEGLRKEVEKIGQGQEPVKLRHTETHEKSVLPTEEDIKFEKHQQCNTPILSAISVFDKDKSLRHSITDEKNLLPTSEEYNQIKQEKQAFRAEISGFDAKALKHVTTEEKHDVAAIDEAGDK